MALRYFTLSSSLCAETIGGAWEVRLEKNMERVRAMLGISFYLYEVGSARAPKGFPWWTAGMKIDPRVPNTLIRKDYSIVNFTNIYSVSTQIRYLSKPQKWYSPAMIHVISDKLFRWTYCDSDRNKTLRINSQNMSTLLRAVHPGTIAMTDFRQRLRPKVLTRHLGDL